jgi:hypothetical protein
VTNSNSNSKKRRPTTLTAFTIMDKIQDNS